MHEAPPAFVRAQLDAIFDDIGVDAAKTGMLFSARIIEAVADFLGGAPDVPLVVDPVMVAASGAKLLEDDAVDVLVAELFPLATVVTPNLHEACTLLSVPYDDAADRRALAEGLHGLGRPGRRRHRRPRRRGRGLALRRRAARAPSPSSATARRRPTAPAARTRRASPRSSPGARASRRRRAGLRRSQRPRRSSNGLADLGRRLRARSTSSTLRLSELGEFGLLAELERRGLVRGQDAEGAVLADGVVVTQDTLVEGVHFRLDWIPGATSGYKAAAVNLSDLAALGAEPEALLVSLALPPETDCGDVVELYEGLAEAGVPVAGGDTTRAETARRSP